MESMYRPAPPHDINMEMAILGNMIMDPECAADAQTLTPDYFYRNVNSLIFTTIVKMVKEKTKIDILTLADELKKADYPTDTIYEDLNMITTAGIITSSYSHYKKILKEKMKLRKIIISASEIVDNAYANGASSQEVEHMLKKALDESQSYIGESGFVHIKDVLLEAYDVMVEDHEKVGMPGIPTGYEDIDEMVTLEKSGFVIVSGVPSAGKTTLAMNFVERMTEKYSAGIITCEMSDIALAEKMVLSKAYVKSEYIRRKKEKMKQQHWDRIAKYSGVLSKRNVFFNKATNKTALDLRSDISQLKKEHDVDVILIDYLQLIKPHTIGSSNEKIEDIIRELLAIGKDLNVLMIVISSLSRGLDARANKRPLMSDLKGSGLIEYSSDAIFFVYRPSMYDEEEADPNAIEGADKVECIIAKNKQGPTGIAILNYLKGYNLFKGRNE